MALSLSTVLSSGATASYWSISTVQFSAVLRSITINLDGYIDNSSKANGLSPITGTMVIATINLITPLPNVDILTALYNIVQADPSFASSTVISDGT